MDACTDDVIVISSTCLMMRPFVSLSRLPLLSRLTFIFSLSLDLRPYRKISHVFVIL